MKEDMPEEAQGEDKKKNNEGLELSDDDDEAVDGNQDGGEEKVCYLVLLMSYTYTYTIVYSANHFNFDRFNPNNVRNK